jgi:hypothetical protein
MNFIPLTHARILPFADRAYASEIGLTKEIYGEKKASLNKKATNFGSGFISYELPSIDEVMVDCAEYISASYPPTTMRMSKSPSISSDELDEYEEPNDDTFSRNESNSTAPSSLIPSEAHLQLAGYEMCEYSPYEYLVPEQQRLAFLQLENLIKQIKIPQEKNSNSPQPHQRKTSGVQKPILSQFQLRTKAENLGKIWKCVSLSLYTFMSNVANWAVIEI